MASSRWKRFAFFDRHTLNIPNEVLEDVVPRSSNDNNNSKEEHVSLVVTTAGLPLNTRPLQIPKPQSLSSPEEAADTSHPEGEAVGAMWSSLVTCSTIPLETAVLGESPSDHPVASAAISFPTHGSSTGVTTTTTTSTTTPATTAMDGLVLAFLSSPETDFVHCIDVTVRCNPPSSVVVPVTTNEGNAAATPNPNERELEDMDGWRGYLGPFASRSGPTTQTSDTATTSSNVSADTEEDRAICDLAVCRLQPHHHNTPGNNTQQQEQHNAIHLACLSVNRLIVWEDPHLHLSCSRPLMHSTTVSPDAKTWELSRSSSAAHTASDGKFDCVSMMPGVVVIGTHKGAILVYVYNPRSNWAFRRYLRIPPPLHEAVSVVSVKVSETTDANKICVFCVYNRISSGQETTTTTSSSSSGGICCYEMPMPSFSTTTSSSTNTNLSISAPSARHDLDGRYVASRRLVDASFMNHSGAQQPLKNARLTVARPDGLYTYSQTEKVSVSPIDGNKLTVALVPHVVSSSSNGGGASAHHHPTVPHSHRRPLESLEESPTTLGYALLASTDEKSGRDAVDVYDSTNKLVAFHLLLSPGHRAVRAAGVATPTTLNSDGSTKGGRSSALVFTSGGSLVTLTEKQTAEKVDLLVQKNLYSAAVVVAYSDPSFAASEISDLYRRYAEHLYRKGDLSAAMDQYCHTIGTLETAHVIFRFLDAPKIPLLVKYLNQLRESGRATPVHEELLRTCYLKLNDAEAAEAIASSASTVNRASLASVLSNLTANPKEALSTICALEAPEASEILVIHGASLARVLPQETAGVVIALCVGTFSPRSLAQGSHAGSTKELKELVDGTIAEEDKAHEPYPVELFASAFMEQPKMLRLILAHCNRNKCPLNKSLRRALLELTLEEWNLAQRTGDTEALKLRHKEAIAALTDSHSREIGDTDALVICQLAGFDEGTLLLYERLQMTPMLLERYAKDGSEKARRQMMAMCQTDPEILADVLGYFVEMASERLANADSKTDDGSYAEETEDLLDDIQATLALARRQGASPPVRIARILAGEGSGQFSPKQPPQRNDRVSTVPLSVALEYVGTILEESRHEGARLRAEVEEYNDLCNSMEKEIETLLRTSRGLPPLTASQSLNIDELYTTIRHEGDSNNNSGGNANNTNTSSATDSSKLPREAFWREMNRAEGGDSLDTIARFFAKGVIR